MSRPDRGQFIRRTEGTYWDPAKDDAIMPSPDDEARDEVIAAGNRASTRAFVAIIIVAISMICAPYIRSFLP